MLLKCAKSLKYYVHVVDVTVSDLSEQTQRQRKDETTYAKTVVQTK